MYYTKNNKGIFAFSLKGGGGRWLNPMAYEMPKFHKIYGFEPRRKLTKFLCVGWFSAVFNGERERVKPS